MKRILKLSSFIALLCLSELALSQGAVLRGEESPGNYRNLSSVSGILQMSGAGYTYNNITTTGTTVVKSGSGQLHCININSIGTTWVLTIFDNTAGSGAKIGTTSALLALGALCYDITFNTGLTIVTSGVAAGDVTISFR